MNKEFSLQGDAKYAAIKISPDFSYIAAVSCNGLDIWNIGSKTIVDSVSASISAINSIFDRMTIPIAISKNCTFVSFVARFDDYKYTIAIYDRDKHRIINYIKPDTIVHDIQWSKSGLITVEHDITTWAYGGGITEYDVIQGKKLSVKMEGQGIHCISLSPDEKSYALGFIIDGEVAVFSSSAEKIHKYGVAVGSNILKYIPETDNFFLTKDYKQLYHFGTSFLLLNNIDLSNIFTDAEIDRKSVV